jgi:hypothetical protein
MPKWQGSVTQFTVQSDGMLADRHLSSPIGTPQSGALLRFGTPNQTNHPRLGDHRRDVSRLPKIDRWKHLSRCHQITFYQIGRRRMSVSRRPTCSNAVNAPCYG